MAYLSFCQPFPTPRPLLRLAALRRGKENVACLTFTSFKRHRQTPESKHDKKARHVGLAHAAQPSYSALILEIGDFLEKRHTLLRTFRRWRTPVRSAVYVALPMVAAVTGGLPYQAIIREPTILHRCRPWRVYCKFDPPKSKIIRRSRDIAVGACPHTAEIFYVSRPSAPCLLSAAEAV